MPAELIASAQRQSVFIPPSALPLIWLLGALGLLYTAGQFEHYSTIQTLISIWLAGKNRMIGSIVSIYRHRALVGALVSRELKARYRSSLLGMLWSFINPLLLMAVYATVFMVFLRFGMPKYASFLLAGLLPWIWFSSSINDAAVSIVSGGNLIKKVMFPAEILPLVSVLTNLVHYLLSLAILIPFVAIYGAPKPEQILGPTLAESAPSNPIWLVASFLLVMIIQFLFTYGLALALAALTVHLRDIQHIVLNLTTLWFFGSPIIYPVAQLSSTKVPTLLKRLAVDYNPIAYLVVAHHKIFLCRIAPSFMVLMAMLGAAFVVFYLGYLVFDKFRDSFAEEV
ncbi:MAG: hypothetical protein DRH70_01275 [Candidatus Coatesbacteria bacterium]|nr:MAG: hypothetical protein DRH70_01275 [Candidatus Coatesbacteria bacterium]